VNSEGKDKVIVQNPVSREVVVDEKAVDEKTDKWGNIYKAGSSKIS
jgi:hypothetical protein